MTIDSDELSEAIRNFRRFRWEHAARSAAPAELTIDTSLPLHRRYSNFSELFFARGVLPTRVGALEVVEGLCRLRGDAESECGAAFAGPDKTLLQFSRSF